MRSKLSSLRFAGVHPNETGCPTLAASLFLRLGLDSTAENGSGFR
jgi:hypothetical protein